MIENSLRRTALGVTQCGVFELRQYTLHPGQREVLIELFDRELVESQETEGMVILGQFRDLDNPDRFVWMRGFRDMESRQRALAGFYGGPVWQRHRDAANATMVDSSNALLLRPIRVDPRLVGPETRRPPVGADARPSALLVATIFHHRPQVEAGFTALFERLKPLMAQAGGSSLAYFEIETAENTFPALPVRQEANLLVSLARFDDVDAFAQYQEMLSASGTWNGSLLPALTAAPQQLRLAPTSRSLLH